MFHLLYSLIVLRNLLSPTEHNFERITKTITRILNILFFYILHIIPYSSFLYSKNTCVSSTLLYEKFIHIHIIMMIIILFACTLQYTQINHFTTTTYIQQFCECNVSLRRPTSSLSYTKMNENKQQNLVFFTYSPVSNFNSFRTDLPCLSGIRKYLYY